MKQNNKFSFRMSIENDNKTGAVLAVYFQIRKGDSAKVVEYADGGVFADYNRKGELLGIEMLAPCKASVLNKIAVQEPERRFVKANVPVGMLVTS
jgi:hypothetical protein